jgi:DTW domain-containing protein YfiP
VHPDEVSSTVGTAWILRRSITNLSWIRSKGPDLDSHPLFLELLGDPETTPLLLFPGQNALQLHAAPKELWDATLGMTPQGSLKKPTFIVLDGTWTQAHAMLRKSKLLQGLQRVSFETTRPSEYGFKIQPHPMCLSTVEGVHRVMEILDERGWSPAPLNREHDQLIEIFRAMVRFQLARERNPRTLRKLRPPRLRDSNPA